MRRSIAVGWLIGILTFGAGAVIGSNWYDVRMLPSGANNETLRQFATDGCEPVQANSVLFFRCPKLRIR